MLEKLIGTLCALALLSFAFCPAPSLAEDQAACWRIGFSRRQIVPDDAESLYIAGYHSGKKITGVLDHCEARAVWLDAGGEGILLIGIDCVALDSSCVSRIRTRLSDVPGCGAVHVYATHTHAGPDTLGLWGPIGRDGKDMSYMKKLETAAVEAAREAASSPAAGRLYHGSVWVDGMCRDSRYPTVYDDALYQLRFEPDGGGAGVRLLFFGAHAESLRGDNTLLSRDYPGALCDGVKERTGDDALFLPGAIGGLVMTHVFVDDMPRDAVRNMQITAEKLTGAALSIGPASEREIAPRLRSARQEFTVPLDNGVFLLYKMLGILGNTSATVDGRTCVVSELNVILLDDIALALIPGEIFPELVLGGSYGEATGGDPAPLRRTAAALGFDTLLIIGLADDELGYIVPPSDFKVNPALPYLERIVDERGEDHYEETNSVGPECARCVAEAFAKALERAAGEPNE